MFLCLITGFYRWHLAFLPLLTAICIVLTEQIRKTTFSSFKKLHLPYSWDSTNIKFEASRSFISRVQPWNPQKHAVRHNKTTVWKPLDWKSQMNNVHFNKREQQFTFNLIMNNLTLSIANKSQNDMLNSRNFWENEIKILLKRLYWPVFIT